MWFDAEAVLARLNAGEKQQFAPPPPATIATTATNTPGAHPFVAVVAVVAAPRPQKLETTPGASDFETYFAYLRANGLATYGAVAVAVGWGATRAWQAEAHLIAAKLVRHESLGKAAIVSLPNGNEIAGFAQLHEGRNCTLLSKVTESNAPNVIRITERNAPNVAEIAEVAGPCTQNPKSGNVARTDGPYPNAGKHLDYPFGIEIECKP